MMGETLAYERVEGGAARTQRWHFVLHGILGRRMNWRRFAQQLCDRRPQDGFVLVDLPEHGDSPDSQAPHSIASTSGALADLEATLGHPIVGGVGHSFGGKVLTDWAVKSPSRPKDLWIIDSNPIARPDGKGSELTKKLIGELDEIPRVHDDRRSFVARIREHGYDESLAQWLAMNLRRQDDDRLVFRPELDRISALMTGYFLYDGGEVIEAPNPDRRWNLVIAGRSSNYLRNDRDRALTTARTAAHVQTHIIEKSGHWVHIDAPDELLNLMSPCDVFE